MFVLTENDKKNYKSIILLNELINSNKSYRTILNGDDQLLEPLFIDLMANDCVSIVGQNYKATNKGHEIFSNFMKRYQEYLKMYDVFSFVDLEKGEFAFSHYFDFNTDQEWDKFKVDKRFNDLRISVALFKKLNPAEVVFMSFINENRFDTTSTGWQMDLLSDSIWDLVNKICETAIKPEELGDNAMVDMITQGSEIALNLIKEEESKKAEITSSNSKLVSSDQLLFEEEQVIDYEYEDGYSYYEPYMDPYFVSAIWLTPLFFLK
jgi:hypothetical protein